MQVGDVIKSVYDSYGGSDLMIGKIVNIFPDGDALLETQGVIDIAQFRKAKKYKYRDDPVKEGPIYEIAFFNGYWQLFYANEIISLDHPDSDVTVQDICNAIFAGDWVMFRTLWLKNPIDLENSYYTDEDNSEEYQTVRPKDFLYRSVFLPTPYSEPKEPLIALFMLEQGVVPTEETWTDFLIRYWGAYKYEDNKGIHLYDDLIVNSIKNGAPVFNELKNSIWGLFETIKLRQNSILMEKLLEFEDIRTWKDIGEYIPLDLKKKIHREILESARVLLDVFDYFITIEILENSVYNGAMDQDTQNEIAKLARSVAKVVRNRDDCESCESESECESCGSE